MSPSVICNRKPRERERGVCGDQTVAHFTARTNGLCVVQNICQHYIVIYIVQYFSDVQSAEPRAQPWSVLSLYIEYISSQIFEEYMRWPMHFAIGWASPRLYIYIYTIPIIFNAFPFSWWWGFVRLIAPQSTEPKNARQDRGRGVSGGITGGCSRKALDGPLGRKFIIFSPPGFNSQRVAALSFRLLFMPHVCGGNRITRARLLFEIYV